MDRPSIGDSVYIRSKGLISDMIVYIETGGINPEEYPEECPSHSARIFSIENGRIKLIEVTFTGKRYYWLDDYIAQGAQVWVKRDSILNDTNITILLGFLQRLEVKGYDWQLIVSFLVRFILRKIFPKKWNFNWVSRIWQSKIKFVCSEFQNAGRRAIGMDIPEQETPWDNFRKISAENITAYNV